MVSVSTQRKLFCASVCIVTVFAVLSLFFSTVPALARPAMPLTTTQCSFGCHDYENWTGLSSTHGILSTVEVSNPTLSSGYFMKYTHLKGTYTCIDFGTCDLEVKVGIENNDPNRSAGINGCNSGTGTQFFYAYLDQETIWAGGTNDSWAYFCFNLHAGDANKDVTIGSSYFVSHGGGLFFYIYGTGSGTNPCPSNNPCSVGDGNATNPFSDAYLEQEYENASFSGHAIWGTDWVNNQYFNGSWNYWGIDGIQYWIDNGGSSHENGGDKCPLNLTGTGIPTQLCWQTQPSTTGSNGGTLYTCDYDSTINTCTVGS